jgi:hypothetical protein
VELSNEREVFEGFNGALSNLMLSSFRRAFGKGESDLWPENRSTWNQFWQRIGTNDFIPKVVHESSTEQILKINEAQDGFQNLERIHVKTLYYH